MSSVNLQVNDLVQVRILGGEVRESFQSRVEDLRNDEIFISWPTERGKPLPVSPRDGLAISFVHEGKYFTFEAVVLRTAQVPVPVIILRPESESRRLERRSDIRIRVAVALDLSEKVVSLAGYKSQGDHASIHALTEDLSGGGFSIIHSSFVPPGTLYEVRMTLPDSREALSLAAKVVRCNARINADGSDFEVAFAYVQIPERARSRIVRFVFASQISELHASD